MLAVLTSLGVFILVLIMRLLYYYQYPSDITLSVEYNKGVTFPQVTVCNQDPFRLE